jgi:hypothetical protein
MEIKKQQISIKLRLFKHVNHLHLMRLIFLLKFRNAVRFYVQILLKINTCLDPNAILSVGIAPLDLDKHSGQYNNSLGYHNNTGRIYTSWKAHANTLGLQYGKGNTIAIYVTYFGEHISTVLIYHDNSPIATRYDLKSAENILFINFLDIILKKRKSVIFQH